MLQITADLSALTTEQRNAVAAFIINFPTKNNFNINHEEDEDEVVIPAFSTALEDEPSPEEAFRPTPATTSIALVVAALPASPTTGAVVLDKNGIPWDERIHASSRAQNADGSWRRKRGVDDATASPVESELKALMGLPAAPPPPLPPVAAITSASTDDRQAFVKLLSKASALITGGKLTQDELNSAVISTGVVSLPLLAHRMDLVPQVEAIIDATVAGR